MSTPEKPQPFDPPVPAASVWAIPREGVGEIAAMLYAQVTWGREPHHSQVSENEMRAWESVRLRWERATEHVLMSLQDIGHVVIVEDNSREDAA